jgi:NAD(P)-dependent dehydrogenase (short-subunit alcohol dehydrogenase family)
MHRPWYVSKLFDVRWWLITDNLQAYNSSKAALNALTVHHAYVLAKTKPESRVVSLTPGYCATNLNGFSGFLDPKIGAAGVVLAITQGPESEWKTAEFRSYDGSLEPW